MRAKPYSRYKPSGVEWLGNVPEHWGTKRGRFAMRVNPNPPNLLALKPEDEVSFVPMEAIGVNGGINLEQTRALADISAGYTAFQEADVVVAKITPCFENGKGTLAVGLLNGIAYGTTELHVLRAKKNLDPKFLFYLSLSDAFRKLGEAEMYGAGGQKRVPPEFNKDFPVTIPPLVEQRSIADFLDRETERLDGLVAKKQELIERLNEKRTALISWTVTRGLRSTTARAAGFPKPPVLNPSGIDWLGEIPAEWETIRFRRLLTQFDQGWSPNANNYPAAANELGILKLGAARKGRFYPEENKALDEIPEGLAPITPARGDLLISRANTPKLVGDVCIVKDNRPDRIIPDLIYRLRLRANTSGDFICWLLQSRLGRALVESDARGSSGSMVKLGQGHVRAWRIPLPPHSEQVAIAAYLDTETAKLDALVAKVEEAVERLQEYRTALITAAVTGKIDVRQTT